MRAFFYIILGFTIYSCTAISNKQETYAPEWAKETSRNFLFPPKQFYYTVSKKNTTNFSSKVQKDYIDELKRELEANLVKEIFEEISLSSVVTEVQTTNKSTEYVSSAVNQSSRKTSLNLFDKKFEFYTDKKKGYILGILYLNKSKLAEGYKKFLSGKIDELNYLMDAKNKNVSDIKEKFKNLSNQMEVYNVINDLKDDETRKNYSDLLKKYSENNNSISEFNEKIINLINSAEEQYSQKNYAGSLGNFNEVLLYDSTNEIAIKRKKEILNEWISVLNKKISVNLSNNDYKSALNDLDALMSIDKSNESVYKITQQNIVEKTIFYIKEILKKGLVTDANKIYEEIIPYYYTNTIAFDKLKVDIDVYNVENAIKSINNAIYEKEYEQALRLTMAGVKKYPNDNSLSVKMNDIEGKLLDKKKTELLNLRPTRWIFELNYSMATMPLQFQTSPQNEDQKFNMSKIDTKNLLPHYQIGLYKKVAIRDLDSGQGSYKKHKFSYSQLGVRIGMLNAAKYPFETQTSPAEKYTYDKAQLFHVEASYIWHSFLMFNVGYLMETLPEVQVNNTIKEAKANYFSSTVGLRLPFSNPFHLTGEVTGFSQDGKTVKIFAKAGISWNIGFGRKYTHDDEVYIQNEIAKIKNF